MKIGFVINDISCGRGSERVAITIANELSRWYEVQFISLNQINQQSFFSVDKKVIIIPLPDSEVSNKLAKKLQDFRYITKCITQYRFDILVGVGSYPSTLLGMIKKVGSKQIKCLGWEHANRSALRSYFWNKLRKIFYRELDGLICLNLSDEIDYKGYAKSIKVIPNPLAFQSIEIAPLNTKTIISIGALETEKGFDLLIEAFKIISNRIPDWKLVIIGEGSMKDSLEKQIKSIGVGERISIKPAVIDVRKEYLQASIYVLPSRREGFGMVLIEAMECGVPCISFDCPTGPKHIITHDKNGILVPPNDIGKLAAAIYDLISNHEKMQKLAIDGKTAVKKYRREFIVGHWQACLNEITSV